MAAQQDLFEVEATCAGIDAAFKTARRHALDAHSWVDVVPGWMSGSHHLLERLAETVAWEQRDRRMFEQTVREPRLTGNYSDMRNVSDKALVAAVSALSANYGIPYDTLWLNFYRDGEDSTAWHRDRVSRHRTQTIVPVLTLGATRRFLMKPRAGGKSIVFKPASGDLVVMGGRAQEDWLHSVPKESSVAERRISINFQSSTQGSGKLARDRPDADPASREHV